MEIYSRGQAGCERNKGRHGRVMNNLDVEQPDLNTWVTTCRSHCCESCGIINAAQWLSVNNTAVPSSMPLSVYEQAVSVNTACFVCKNPMKPMKAGEKKWKAVWGSYTKPVALMSYAAGKKDDPQWAFYSVTEWDFWEFMLGIKD